jgi:hypothetical protein
VVECTILPEGPLCAPVHMIKMAETPEIAP